MNSIVSPTGRRTALRLMGQALQLKVREALDQMVGIPADQVNVYIEDVTE